MGSEEHNKLDQVLAEASSNPEVLVDVVGHFSLLFSESGELAQSYAEKIEKICRKWDKSSELPQGIVYLIRALSYFYKGSYANALNDIEKASTILSRQPYPELHGTSLLFWGGTLRGIGELDEAVQKFMRAADLIHPEGPYASYSIYCNYQLAEIYADIKDYQLSEKHYKTAAKSAEKIQDIGPLFRSYSGLGGLYSIIGQHDEALEYLEKSVEIANSESQISRGLCDLGIHYMNTGEFEKAGKHLEKSYEIRVKNQLEDASSTSLIHLCDLELRQGNWQKAFDYGEKALDIASRFKAKNKLLKCHKLLAGVHEKKADWEKAYQHQKKYDELYNEISSVKIQKIYKLKNKRIEEQKKAIEEAHQEITDSIQYAQRIQTAILPSKNLVDHYLQNAFILYKPKDIVAGDFYWFEPTEQGILFAAADCTGHGVPGAMVSVVCNNALNRSVREFGLREPAAILDKVREIVIDEFGKSEEEVKDGMDIALCCLEDDKLYFAGAHNPLWIIRKNTGEIEEIKGNKQPIGKFDQGQPFSDHEIELRRGDTFYIFSDGFSDQFGGDKGKKFKSKNFKRLLLSVCTKTMEEQKESIDEAFMKWKGDLEQLDDVCVIGVRI